MAKTQALPINREVLTWARERMNLSYEDAASVARMTPEQVKAWESGRKVPTARQARILADVYERPFLEFFAKQTPEVPDPSLAPDFRMHRDATSTTDRYELIRIQSEAEETRLNALELFELLGEQPPHLPEGIFANLGDSCEAAAARARSLIGPTPADQTSLKATDRGAFAAILRAQFEAAGLLVLKNSQLSTHGVRGICLFAPVLPVIVFSAESPGAQAFTLAHELGHIVLQQSAISGLPGSAAASAEKIERWCDAFAAAYLVPAESLAQFLKKPSHPAEAVDDKLLSAMANRFAVSRHAMLVRLVELRYVEPAYYWRLKRPQFIEEEKAYKSKGRSSYFASRYRSSRGDLYTGLVMDAWSNGAITNHTAAEFMGMSHTANNIAHLEAIRERFRA